MTGDAPSPGQGPGPAVQARHAAQAAPLALYRRYRPASFAEVKGQDHVTEPLRQALRSGRVHHAYLFSGPRGCGKTSSARILARSLNCESGPTPDPCGVCASCVALAPTGPGSIDVIEIDAASHGGVDDARDLRERAFYAPVSGRFKIYIIDEAHMVTREGFNALLKLVEEPPPHLKFVFATTEPEKVIPTIRSRTHHYPFRLVPPAVLRELLERILGSEGVAYEPAVLPVVIRAGAGSVRDSLSVLDQLIAGSDESGLSYARAVALLGYTDERLLDEVAQAFAARDGAEVFNAINRVVEAGHDPRRFAADLLDRLRDLIILAAVPDAGSTGLLDVPADRLEAMRAQAERFGQAELTRAAEIISAGLVEMRGATSPRLLLELMCAQVLLPGDSAADLTSRLERLERKLESLGSAGTAAAQPGRPAARPASEAAQRSGGPAREPAGVSERRDGVGEDGSTMPEPAPAPALPSRTPASGRPEPAAGVNSLPQPAAASASQPAGPAAAWAGGAAGSVDASLLQARWPEVLESVRRERKVAWILLTNATVESLTDGVLTVEFAREGDAKGFAISGHDRILAEVLQQMFGISPQLKAIARTSGAAPGGASRAPAGPAGPGGSGGRSGGSPSGPGGTGGRGPGGTGAPSGTGSATAGAGTGSAAQDAGNDPRPGAGDPQARGDDPQASPDKPPATWNDPSVWDDDPRDDDGDEDDATGPPGPGPLGAQDARPGLPPAPAPGPRSGPAQDPAPGTPTAMDLIERELGGRLIKGIGDA